MSTLLHDDFDESELFGMATVASSGNPLAAFFRTPGINVKLPTNGAYLPKGAITLDAMGTVTVYPMRAADELLLKSPDALMSGYAIESMLASCVPDIKTPKLVSTPDLDVLLLAIRAASFGEYMDIEAVCPKCKTENSFSCHLPSVLATVVPLPPECPVRLSDDVVVYLRPYTMEAANTVTLATFEETRKAQALEVNESTAEEKQAHINAAFARMTKLSDDMLASCIIKVVVPTAEVTNPKHIREFIAQTSREWSARIDNALKEMNEKGMDRGVDVVCAQEKCRHAWKTDVEFNPANFFGPGS